MSIGMTLMNLQECLPSSHPHMIAIVTVTLTVTVMMRSMIFEDTHNEFIEDDVTKEDEEVEDVIPENNEVEPAMFGRGMKKHNTC